MDNERVNQHNGRARLFVAGAVMLACAVGSAQDQGERKIQQAIGKPIASLIRPNEPSLTVMQFEFPPDRVSGPDTMSLAEWLVLISDAIVVARTTSLNSHLTTKSDWIETDVRSVITEVLKVPPGVQLNAGDPLTMIDQGGDLRIGSSLVKARVPNQRPMRQGATYLLFFNIVDLNTPNVLPGAPLGYELTSAGRLIRLFNDDVVKDDPDDIENVLSSQAIADLRDAIGAIR